MKYTRIDVYISHGKASCIENIRINTSQRNFYGQLEFDEYQKFD